MLDRRHALMSSVLFSLFLSSAAAQEPTSLVEDHSQTALSVYETINLSFREIRYCAPSDSFLDSVTTRSLPTGSLITRFDGVESVIVRELRGQLRRFTRQAVREGWCNPAGDDVVDRDFYERLDRAWVSPQVNGAWWQRRWWESLPPEKGGAPATPYVHTFGKENSWRLGPFTATNTLKLRIDYLAFFEVTPDPIDLDHSRWPPPITLDVRTVQPPLSGTFFSFDVRPRFQFGLPQTSTWYDVVRGVSIQFSFEFWSHSKKVVKGDIELSWRPEDGLAVALEVSIVSW